MSIPYREYMANAGGNGIHSSTRQSVHANLSDNHLKKANINLNVVVPNLDNNGIQAQAQAQSCGGGNDYCPPSESYCESSSSCESSSYECTSVKVCKKKPKCKKYEYVVKKNKPKYKKNKCYDYKESCTDWFESSTTHYKGGKYY